MNRNYIPIYAYCKKTGASKQNVYRWIRERKFTDDEVKNEEVKLRRIRIDENALPKLR